MTDALSNPYLCRYCFDRFPTDEAREEHFKHCKNKLRVDKTNEKVKKDYVEYQKTRPKKTLAGIQKRLEELYLGKKCRTGRSGEFKKVVKIETWGHPSAWSWHGNLIYEDGTKSNFFKGIRKVEVEE